MDSTCSHLAPDLLTKNAGNCPSWELNFLNFSRGACSCHIFSNSSTLASVNLFGLDSLNARQNGFFFLCSESNNQRSEFGKNFMLN